MKSYLNQVLALFEYSFIFIVTLMSLDRAKQIGQAHPGQFSLLYIVIAIFLAAALTGLHLTRKNLLGDAVAGFLMRDAQRQADFLDAITSSWRSAAIITLAGVSLFFELMMIRWQGSLFPVFALYKNFTLLACFAGLGAGYATAGRRQISLLLVLPVMFMLVLALTLLRYDTGELYHLFFALPDHEQSSIVSIFPEQSSSLRVFLSLLPLYVMLCGVFLLTALVFYPVGQACGRVMEKEVRLKAYGLNLLGSVAGVLCMIFFSYLWTPPAVWMAAIIVALVLFLQYDKNAMIGGVITSALIMIVMLWPVHPESQQIYSPYQLIERSGKPDGLMQILAAGSYYQKVYDLSFANKNRYTDPELKKIAAYYELPFKIAPSNEKVAIVGAGSGNDVAASLRMGAKHVDAIEIDPVLPFLGRFYHPEEPYSDPRVNLIINDARTFFRQASPGYDLVVYGVLDSHTLLSHASNVRVDSFVYTKEGIEDSYRLLKPGGIVSLSFALPVDALGYKIFQIFKHLPGASDPVAILVGYDAGPTTTFLVRKGEPLTLPPTLLSDTKFRDISSNYDAVRPAIDIPTDDWPFFYMAKRVFPTTYVIALCLILTLCVYFVRANVGPVSLERANLPFFFLGAGFMLVETKAITELGLYFGNTWLVIGVVIIGLLIMAYLANRAVEAWRLSHSGYSFMFLFAAIATGYYVATHGKLDTASPLAYGLIVLLLISPMFFSGLIFSTLLKRASVSISPVMAYNLLGALLGGLLEYNSMYFGFAFLYVIAGFLYLLAWLTIRPPASEG